MENKINSLLPIEVKHLNYIKGKRTLLNKISCKISSNGMTIILGPNGAGKTLLLKCLHGLISYDRSKVLFSDSYIDTKIRLQQSMVFQTPILLRRSVINNLIFVTKQRKIKISKENILKILNKVDLLSLANESATLLSGGEKQRLSLARAIITSPKILFLDEATSNLDPYSTQIIEKIIKEVNNRGTKVIAVTHDLSQAKRLADDIVFINKGIICEHSDALSFFKKPKSIEGSLFISGKLII